MGGAPGPAVPDVSDQKVSDDIAGRRFDKVQCHLNLIELMELYLLLKGLNAGDPGRRIVEGLCK